MLATEAVRDYNTEPFAEARNFVRRNSDAFESQRNWVTKSFYIIQFIQGSASNVRDARQEDSTGTPRDLACLKHLTTIMAYTQSICIGHVPQILGYLGPATQNTRYLEYLNIFGTRNTQVSEAPDPTFVEYTNYSVRFLVAFRILDCSDTRTREIL